MVHPNETTATTIIVLVAVVSLVLTVLAASAWRRAGNTKLGFVTGAFAVFFVKSTLTAYSVQTGFIAHEELELVGSLGDLIVVVLLVAPFLAPLMARSP